MCRQHSDLSFKETTDLDPVSTRMIQRASDVDSASASVLNQLAHTVFWTWHRCPLNGYISFSYFIVNFKEDPSLWLYPGVDVRLERLGSRTITARVISVDCSTSENWKVKLSSRKLHQNSLCVSRSPLEVTVFWRNTPRVDDLATRAYYGSSVPATRAEAYYILGRNRHVNCDILGATPFYAHACQLAPKFALAHFRLAQVQAAAGDLLCRLYIGLRHMCRRSCFSVRVCICNPATSAKYTRGKSVT